MNPQHEWIRNMHIVIASLFKANQKFIFDFEGHIYPSGCTASWMGYNEVLAGTKASILILPSDAFGNNLEKGAVGPSDQYFNLSVSYENGLTVRLADFKFQGWNDEGYISLDFILTVSGNFLVHVLGDNKQLRNSPLPLAVKPGWLTEIGFKIT